MKNRRKIRHSDPRIELIALAGKRSDVTLLYPCLAKISSEYGDVFYENWCKREIYRMRNKSLSMRYKEYKHVDFCCITRIMR